MKPAPSNQVLEIGPSPKRDGLRPNAELEWIANLMDGIFHVPGLGLRFGLDAILGLIPGVGDTLTTVVSVYILTAANRLGVSRLTIARMASNVAIDYLVGSIPLLGDVFDVYWKSNQKNVALLRRHLETTPEEQRRSRRGDWFFLAIVIALLLLVAIGSVVLAYYVLSTIAGWIFGR